MEKQIVKVSFYKSTGKWYAEGIAIVHHPLWQTEEFKQDIVNSQNALIDTWSPSFYVAVSASEGAEGFYEHLFMPGAFEGLKRQIARV